MSILATLSLVPGLTVLAGGANADAAIRAGHRLRLSIQGFDVPHLLPTIPNIAQLAPLKVYASDVYPSVLTIPARTSP